MCLIERSGLRALDVQKGEVTALLWSFGYFFLVLTAYYILRPIRDEMGVVGGVKNLAWLLPARWLARCFCIPSIPGWCRGCRGPGSSRPLTGFSLSIWLGFTCFSSLQTPCKVSGLGECFSSGSVSSTYSWCRCSGLS